MSEYKEIDLKAAPEPESIIEVELEDVTAEPEQKPVEENTDESQDSGDEKPKEEKKKTPPTKRKPSRAQKRIKQVLSEKAELEAQLEEERQARFKAEQQYKVNSKDSKEGMKDNLEANLTTLTKALKEAMENGDAEAAVQLQDQMMNSKMQLAAVSAEINQLDNEPEVEYQPQTKQQQAPEISEKALDWVDQYPQFKTDELFYVSALTVNKQLVNEGFDAESDEFYEELNTRLSTRFPEVFGIADENSVKYNQTPSNEELADENNDSSHSKDDSNSIEIEQTVSSSSRTPPHQGGKKHSGTSEKVKLSAADVAQAERWGFSLDKMARRVAHRDKHRNSDGYTPIKIETKSK